MALDLAQQVRDLKHKICLYEKQLESFTPSLYFKQKGNAFGERAILGTKDDFPLAIITKNEVRVNIKNTGEVEFKKKIFLEEIDDFSDETEVLVRNATTGEVKKANISVIVPPLAIDSQEIVYGTGTGITSSDNLKFTGTNLIVGSTADTGHTVQIQGTARISGNVLLQSLAANTTSTDIVVSNSGVLEVRSLSSIISGGTLPTGSGTANHLVRWITSTTQGIGATRDDGTNVTIGSGGNMSSIFTLAKSVTADSDSSLMITFENTQSGYHDWRTGVYFISGNSNFVIQGGNAIPSALTTHMAIDSSSGNVRFGTTVNSGYKVDINGTLRITGASYHNSTVVVNHTNPLIGFINGSGTTFGANDPIIYYQAGHLRLTDFNSVTKGLHIDVANNRGAFGTNSGLVGTGFIFGGSITASSAIARGVYVNNTLVAAANNDVLVGAEFAPSFTNGAFTGVLNIGARVRYSQTTPYTSSSSSLYIPAGANMHITNSATGISNAYSGLVFNTLNSTGTVGGVAYMGLSNENNFGGSFVIGMRTGATSYSEYLRIFSDGNVGINTTTNAGQKLQVNGTSLLGGDTTVSGILSTNGINYQSGSATQRLIGGGTSSLRVRIFTTDGWGGQHWTDQAETTILWTIGNNTVGSSVPMGIGVTMTSSRAVVDASAILEVKSSTKGFLPPRNASPSVNISSPATGLLAYNTTSNQIDIYDGTRWNVLAKTLTGSVTHDFASVAALSVVYVDITVTGAAQGDSVALGVDNMAVGSCNYFARVVAADTVRVYFENLSSAGAIDPPNAVYKVTVFKN